MADVTVTLGADNTAFMNGVQEMRADLKKILGGIEKHTKKMSDGGVSNLARFGQAFMGIKSIASTVIGAISGIATGLMNITRGAAAMTDLKNSMTALSGDAKGTKAALDELGAWGPQHGIDDEWLVKGAEKMMTAGMKLKDAVRATKNMAVISAGDENTTSLLSQQVAKAQAGEGLTNRDLKAFEAQGIDLRSAIGDVLGVAKEEVADLVKEAVPVDVLTEAIGELAKPGGKLAQRFDAYDQGFDSASKRVSLTWDRCMDEIGASIEGPMKEAMGAISDFLLANRARFASFGEGIAEILRDLPRMIEFLQDVGDWIRKPFLFILDWCRTVVRFFVASIGFFVTGKNPVKEAADYWQRARRKRERDDIKEKKRQEAFDAADRKAVREGDAHQGSTPMGRLTAGFNFAVGRALKAADKAEQEQAKKAKKEAAAQEKKLVELRRKFEEKERAFFEARRKDQSAILALNDRRRLYERRGTGYGIDMMGGRQIEKMTEAIRRLSEDPQFAHPAYQKQLASLQKLRDDWAAYEKEKEAYFRREEARASELAALRAEVAGNEEEVARLREVAAMREKINGLISEGVERETAAREVAEETALRKLLDERKKKKELASTLQGATNHSLVDVGGARGRVFDMNNNLLDQGKQQTALQTMIARLLTEIRDNTGHATAAVLG